MGKSGRVRPDNPEAGAGRWSVSAKVPWSPNSAFGCVGVGALRSRLLTWSANAEHIDSSFSKAYSAITMLRRCELVLNDIFS